MTCGTKMVSTNRVDNSVTQGAQVFEFYSANEYLVDFLPENKL